MASSGRRRHLASFALPGVAFSLCGCSIDLARTERLRGRISRNLFRPDCASCTEHIWRVAL